MRQKLFERMGKRLENGIMPAGKLQGSYYWIWAIKDSRLIVVGCKTSEQEAYQFGYAKLGEIDFRVEELPTRDMDTAVRMIKGKVLDKTANLDLSIKRARRK